MISPAHTRVVLVAALFLLLAWEAATLAWGSRDSTISVQLRAAGQSQPFLVIGLWFALGAHWWWPT